MKQAPVIIIYENFKMVRLFVLFNPTFHYLNASLTTFGSTLVV